MTQATNEELLSALWACKGISNDAPNTKGWRRRVEHLTELLNTRHRWATPEDKDLQLEIRRYLRGAGVSV